MKLRTSLSYLGIDPESRYKQKKFFRRNNKYDTNHRYVRSLQDADFIPYSNDDADTFLDAVDGNHTVFSPDLLEVNKDNEEDDFNKEE